MARVLLISLSDLGSDPRVRRQIVALRDRHEVVTAAFGPPKDDVAFVELVRPQPARLTRHARTGLLRLAGRDDAAYWAHAHTRSWAAALADVRPDLVIANNSETLPLAFAVNAGAPVIVDEWEHAPSLWETLWWWRLLMRPSVVRTCRRYLPRTAEVLTVCEGIAQLYREEFGVRPVVVTNAAPLAHLSPTPVHAPIRMVHFGGADPTRRIEDMLRVMDHLDERYTLDLILVRGPGGYAEKLERSVAGDARIRFLEPVPMEELPRFANAYDIGLYLLAPTHANHRLALPNKFFEFVQGRLAVAIGPSPEMARLAREYDFGIVAEDFEPESLAAAIRATSPERIAELKRHADTAAPELSSERGAEVFLGVVERVLAAHRSADR